MIELAAIAAAACVCFGVGTNLTIPTRLGTPLVPRSAVGMALIATWSIAPTPGYLLALVAGGLICSLAARLVMPRPAPGWWSSASALCVSGAAAMPLRALLEGMSRQGAAIALVALSSVAFLAADRLGHRVRLRALLSGDALSLNVMSMSLAAATVLTAPSLTVWSYTFLVMLLLVSRTEFGQLAEAHRTYDQLVGALGRVIERAGYVPDGHHERVDQALVRCGEGARMRPDSLTAARLGVIGYSIGFVSLGDPSDLRETPLATVVSVGRDSARGCASLLPSVRRRAAAEDDRERELALAVLLSERERGSRLSEVVGILEQDGVPARRVAVDVLEAQGPL
ncbi:MAG TPA: hypothetical protein VM840_01035 [Actinomycetota bacterium]|nr:hypothetical protein [Actinomycetota bacterium]